MEISKELHKLLRLEYSPDGSTLRKSQLRMVEMLICFDKVCRDNNLEYWLDFGTLLGAVRHGGFIPWDDDVDVAMKRSDAMKLKKIWLKNYQKEQFVYQCHETDSFHFRFWDKIRDIKSANVAPSYIQDRLKYKGLAIDIFIMDDHTIGYIKQKCTSLFHYLLLLPLYSDNEKWNRLRPIVPLFYYFLRLIAFPLARLMSLFRHNNYLSYSYGLPWTHKFPKDIIYPLSTIVFEGHKLMVPAKCEEYLHIIYGDWKKIPQPKDIRTHGVQMELYF